MKRVLFVFSFFFVFAHSLNAQVLLTTAQRKIYSFSKTVITPTKENLVALVNCSVEQFKATMEYYGYYPAKGHVGRTYRYSNSSLDFYMYENDGVGINDFEFDPYENTVTMIIMRGKAYPDNCIQDLYQSLIPYYTKSSEEGADWFLTEDQYYYYGYRILVTQEGDILVDIKRFDKHEVSR
jgi:hypothetical protein